MIIHLMFDPPPAYEPLVIVDRSPFHSVLASHRSATSKMERWFPRTLVSTLASRLTGLMAAGRPTRGTASVETSPPWTVPPPDAVLTGGADR